MTVALRRDLGWTGKSLAWASGCLLLVAMVVPACTGGDSKSLAEKMAADPREEALAKAGYKPNPKPRPQTGYEPPSDADFKAWDRKDPEGEKHLHKFDRANMKKLLNYWGELECFRDKMKEEGEKAAGAEPGSALEEQWHQFKQVFILMVNTWQQRLLANEPGIMEKSKLIGHFFEAHELVMHGYPTAYNENDTLAIQTADANWAIIDNKILKYLKSVSGEDLPKPDLTDPKVKEKHDKFCYAAMHPPKNTGKAKVKHVGGGSRGPKKLNMGSDD